MFKALLSFLGGGPAEQIGEYFVAKAKLKQQLSLMRSGGKIAAANAKTEAAVQKRANIQSWMINATQPWMVTLSWLAASK